jgi:hypothetical protein
MPVVRKLVPEEVQTLEYKPKGQRKLTEEQYNSFLADYEVGDYGEAELGDDENRLTVRNRFKAAATRRGIGLDFKRTKGSVLRFKVIDSSEHGQASNGTSRAQVAIAPPVIEEPPAPVKKKGGRPKKNP